MARVALGIKPHTGWAIVVAVDDTGGILARRRMTMVDDDELRFAWHSSQRLERSPKSALAHERKVAKLAKAAADDELAGVVREAGGTVEVAAIVGEPRDLPSAARILASHALLHGAEGELFRSVLADAAQDLGLDVAHVHPKDAVLGDRITGNVGRPWAAD